MPQDQSKSTSTTDHTIIRQWVEQRKGKPATVASTKKPGEIGLLRVKFQSEHEDNTLTEISWDDFFTKFDESNLRFLYQEKTKDGELSRFFKFIRDK